MEHLRDGQYTRSRTALTLAGMGAKFGATSENGRIIFLSRPEKTDPASPARRDFITRAFQAPAALIPGRLGRPHAFDGPRESATDAEFHLHPHYRSQRPLDATLLKTQAGTDEFVTEKYADQIAAILAKWRNE